MINFKFIGELFEGKRLQGYVPPLDGGKIESGVTIACGFDIGQRSTREIESGLGFTLAEKLSPYCGVTGVNAVALLEELPLSISEEEFETINEYAHNDALGKLLLDWKEYTNVSFFTLPEEAQTVIASVAFQYGDLPSRCPNFWKQAVTQDWQSMLRNLWNFGDDYETRRRQEYVILYYGITR